MPGRKSSPAGKKGRTGPRSGGEKERSREGCPASFPSGLFLRARLRAPAKPSLATGRPEAFYPARRRSHFLAAEAESAAPQAAAPPTPVFARRLRLFRAASAFAFGFSNSLTTSSPAGFRGVTLGNRGAAGRVCTRRPAALEPGAQRVVEGALTTDTRSCKVRGMTRAGGAFGAPSVQALRPPRLWHRESAASRTAEEGLRPSHRGGSAARSGGKRKKKGPSPGFAQCR